MTPKDALLIQLYPLIIEAQQKTIWALEALLWERMKKK